ncbi:Endoglucanase [Dactylellina cionopaga]|nr:Endoglucanase [Dactylellina cionopaga]
MATTSAEAPAPQEEVVVPIKTSRRFGILFTVSVVFIAAIVPYIIYRNILQQNYHLAPLDDYPSHKQIALKLNCPGKPRIEVDGYSKRKPPLFKLPLKTKGRDIVDFTGERVKLMSINWYGGSDEDFVPGGLDLKHRKEIAATIREMGFNSVRLPYSDEMVVTNPDVPKKFWSKNPDLVRLKGREAEEKHIQHIQDQKSSNIGAEDDTEPGSNSTITVKALDIFDAVVKALTDEGIAVIVNNHITQARWCCDGNLCDATWANEYLGKVCRIMQTEEQWIQNWETVMRPYVDNPLVIGADLRNENRSPLGKILWASWAAAAEKASIRLHSLQPNWLMFVEGVASSNYLQGVRTRPIVLPIPDRVVYSAHVYGWSGWGALLQGPYWSRDYASFAYDMYDNWGFLLEENIAPVWVGEFGAPEQPNTGDLNYWKNLMTFLEDVNADWAYWAINPRKPKGNETESYAIVHDDWVTPKCDYRMYDMMMKLGLRPYNSTVPSTSTSEASTKMTGILAPGKEKQLPLGNF